MIKLTKKMYTFKTEEEEVTTEAFSERQCRLKQA